MRNELFLDIPGYEGLYEINKNGDIFSKERSVISKNGVVKIYPRRKKVCTKLKIGYYAVGLWKENKQDIVFLHRLIAETFIPNPNNYLYINHIDGNKENNSIENLEWCTQSYNVLHAYKTGLTGRNVPVMCIETGEIFHSQSYAARKLGDINKQSAISQCLLGKRETAFGFHWIRYEKDSLIHGKLN